MRNTTYHWLLLLALTALTTQSSAIAVSGWSASTLVLLVLLTTLIKGRGVIDHFMALSHVRGPWRWIVLGWLLLVLGLIGYAFHLNPT